MVVLDMLLEAIFLLEDAWRLTIRAREVLLATLVNGLRHRGMANRDNEHMSRSEKAAYAAHERAYSSFLVHREILPHLCASATAALQARVINMPACFGLELAHFGRHAAFLITYFLT